MVYDTRRIKAFVYIIKMLYVDNYLDKNNNKKKIIRKNDNKSNEISTN